MKVTLSFALTTLFALAAAAPGVSKDSHAARRHYRRQEPFSNTTISDSSSMSVSSASNSTSSAVSTTASDISSAFTDIASSSVPTTSAAGTSDSSSSSASAPIIVGSTDSVSSTTTTASAASTSGSDSTASVPSTSESTSGTTSAGTSGSSSGTTSASTSESASGSSSAGSSESSSGTTPATTTASVSESSATAGSSESASTSAATNSDSSSTASASQSASASGTTTETGSVSEGPTSVPTTTATASDDSSSSSTSLAMPEATGSFLTAYLMAGAFNFTCPGTGDIVYNPNTIVEASTVSLYSNGALECGGSQVFLVEDVDHYALVLSDPDSPPASFYPIQFTLQSTPQGFVVVAQADNSSTTMMRKRDVAQVPAVLDNGVLAYGFANGTSPQQPIQLVAMDVADAGTSTTSSTMSATETSSASTTNFLASDTSSSMTSFSAIFPNSTTDAVSASATSLGGGGAGVDPNANSVSSTTSILGATTGTTTSAPLSSTTTTSANGGAGVDPNANSNAPATTTTTQTVVTTAPAITTTVTSTVIATQIIYITIVIRGQEVSYSTAVPQTIIITILPGIPAQTYSQELVTVIYPTLAAGSGTTLTLSPVTTTLTQLVTVTAAPTGVTVNGQPGAGQPNNNVGFAPAATPSTGASTASPSPYSCLTTYKVKQGDVCNTIAASNNLSVQQLYGLNPSINNPSCDNLYIGQVLCVGPVTYSCTTVYKVSSGDICSTIANTAGISLATLYGLNPDVNSATCANLYPGQLLCIAGSSLSGVPSTTGSGGNEVQVIIYPAVVVNPVVYVIIVSITQISNVYYVDENNGQTSPAYSTVYSTITSFTTVTQMVTTTVTATATATGGSGAGVDAGNNSLTTSSSGPVITPGPFANNTMPTMNSTIPTTNGTLPALNATLPIGNATM